MPIDFACPHCGKQTRVADQYAGTAGNCAACGQPISIPGVAKSTGSSSSTTTTVIIVVAVCLLGVCVVGGILAALLIPAVGSARDAAQRMSCMNNLKQISLAMHNYHDVYRCFPAAYIEDENGKPMHSWRVALLPFLDRPDLYDRYNFNEPWNSPANMALAAEMPDVFRCPKGAPLGSPMTNYVVVIGDKTMFGPNRWCKMSDIRDGTSNTLMVVETTSPVHWMEPANDLRFDRMSRQINSGPQSISSNHRMTANVAAADGSVHALSNDLPPEVLESLLNIADGRVVSF